MGQTRDWHIVPLMVWEAILWAEPCRAELQDPQGPQALKVLKPSSLQARKVISCQQARTEPSRAEHQDPRDSQVRKPSGPQAPLKVLEPSCPQAPKPGPSRAGPSFEILKALRPSRPSRSPSLQALKLARSSRPVMKSGKSEREPATNLGLGSRKSEC